MSKCLTQVERVVCHMACCVSLSGLEIAMSMSGRGSLFECR